MFAIIALTLASNSKDLALAVLMQRKLIVFTVTSNIQQSQQLSNQNASTALIQYTLNKQYEHKLPRLAFNFTYGPFGGVYGIKFLICNKDRQGFSLCTVI